MSGLPFVNRFGELKSFREALDRDGAELIRLYGRRRLGKTELLSHLAGERGGIYLLVDDAETPRILEGLSSQLARAGVRVAPLAGWDDLWAMVGEVAPRPVVVDEFQRLFERSPEAVTRLQHHWDRDLRRQRAKLVLCGSSVGMMQRIAQGRSGPLFGRLTLDLRLRAFGYAAVRLLYPELEEEQRIERYAVFGGTPHYHQFSPGRGLDEALAQSFFQDGAPFQEEPQNLLQYELRKSSRYNSILYELGNGTHELGQIASKTKLTATSLGPYLGYLMKEFDLIRHHDPVLGRKRRGRYILGDPFFGFYYRFVYPNLSRLELKQAEAVLADVRAGLHDHASRVFEEVAREGLKLLNGKTYQGVEVAFDEIGAWWNRVGEELDIVARARRCVYAGEVKWTAQAPDRGLLDDIDRKASFIEERSGLPVIPVVVSKTPPTPELRAAVRERGGLTLSLQELADVFDQHYARPRPFGTRATVSVEVGSGQPP